MHNLHTAVKEFARIQEADYSDSALAWHRTVAAIHSLCVALREAELNGVSPAEIHGVVADAKAIHSRSPFVNRLQSWPRGYPGDFESIEYICDCKTLAPP